MTPARSDPPEPDPREREPWFQLLPEGHQTRFRADWAAERAAWERAFERRRASVRDTLVAYALLFALANLFAGSAGIAHFLLMALTGAALGALCWKIRTGGLRSGALAVALFFFAHLIYGSRFEPSSIGDAFGFARIAFTSYAVGAFAQRLPDALALH